MKDNKESVWVYKTLEPSKDEERRLVAAVLKISISASFELHVYSFAGKAYKQKVGGPIGSRLTMAVARVVMIAWGRRLQEIVKEGGMELYIAAYYVDDIRLILTLLDKDTIWDHKTRSWKNRNDKEEEQEERTIGIVQWDKEEHRFKKTEKRVQIEKELPAPDETKIEGTQGPLTVNLARTRGPGLENRTDLDTDRAERPEETMVEEEMKSKEEEPIEIMERRQHTKKELNKAMNSIFSFLEFTTELEEDYPEGYMPRLDM